MIEARGGRAIPLEFDIADDESVRTLVSCALDNYGAVNGLHRDLPTCRRRCSASTARATCSRSRFRSDSARSTCALTSPVFCCGARGDPASAEAGGGGITNTVSDANYAGEAVRVGYGTTKTGLTAITRHIASRWGREGIRCNSISPGIIARNEEIETAMLASHRKEPREHGRAVPTTSRRSRRTCSRTTARG